MTVSLEQERIQRAVAGDRAALERLLLDSYEPLAVYLQQRLPDELQRVIGVDDVVQLVFSQVFADIHEFEVRGAGAWRGWLRAIADNRIRDALRAHRAKKRGGDFRQIGSSPGAVKEDFVEELVDVYATTTQTPSREVARAEAIFAIQVAVAGLSSEHQRVIRLRYFQGLAIDDIAQQMDKTPGAVRGLLDRARQKIRDVMQSASCYLSSR